MNTESETYANAFNVAFKHTVQLEGGYVNDPADRGGETNFGISKRSYPDLDIANLTLEQAKAIYWRDYWQPNYCDVLPTALAMAYFDALVNHKPGTAKRLLQNALGVSPDGVIGPATLAAATKAQAQTTLVRFFSLRAQLYHQLVLANSSQEKFALGWFARLFKLQQAIQEECWPWRL